MPEFTKSQLLAMKFDRFDALAASLKKRAEEREASADELVRDVANPQGEGEWTGVAGRAAQDSSHTIGLSMKKQSATEEGAGGPLRETGSSMQSHKDAVAGTMRRIEGDDDMRIFVTYQDGVAPGSYHPEVPSKIYNCGNPVVSEDFMVGLNPQAKQFVDYHGLWDAVVPTLNEDQQGLKMRLQELEDAATKHAQAIVQATDFDQVAKDDKNPLVGETPAQAKEDVDAYMNGTATDAQRKRVETAASALKPGEAPTRERATLLQALSDGMRNKSVGDLNAIQEKNGDHALSNAVELTTDPKLETVGVLDKDGKPWHGGPDNLPQSIKDLDKQPGFVREDGPMGRYPTSKYDYPNLQQCEQLATLIGKADPATQRGTEVDRVAMDKAKQILHGVDQYDRSSYPGNSESADPRGTLQKLLTTAGRDPIVDHDALAGKDGHTTDQQFVRELTQHKWPDGGKAAGTLLDWTKSAGESADPEQRRLAGETVHSVAAYIGDHANDYKHMGQDIVHQGQTIGQFNPELARSLARGLDPQMAAMFEGSSGSPVNGFPPLDNDHKFQHTRDLFSVLDSDKEAAQTIQAASLREELALQNQYAHDLRDHKEPNMADLTTAAKMHGVVDKALQDSTGLSEQEKYALKSNAFDAVKTALSTGLKASGMGTLGGMLIDMSSTWTKAGFIGQAPGLPPLPGAPEEQMMYQVMSSAANNGPLPGDVSQLRAAGLVDASGRLVPLDKLNNFNIEGAHGAMMQYLVDTYGQNSYNAVNEAWKSYQSAADLAATK